jgi:hypothetical protein
MSILTIASFIMAIILNDFIMVIFQSGKSKIRHFEPHVRACAAAARQCLDLDS